MRVDPQTANVLLSVYDELHEDLKKDDSEAVDADAGDNHDTHDNINEGHDDKTDSRVDHASHSPDDRLDLPPPVYPTINKKNKKNTFTKDQIIDLYCASTQDLR